MLEARLWVEEEIVFTTSHKGNLSQSGKYTLQGARPPQTCKNMLSAPIVQYNKFNKNLTLKNGQQTTIDGTLAILERFYECGMRHQLTCDGHNFTSEWEGQFIINK